MGGVRVCHDSDQDVAVLYCSTTDRALHSQVFEGDDARDQAEVFLAWASEQKDVSDVRRIDAEHMDALQDEFFKLSSRPECDHRIDWSFADEHLDGLGLDDDERLGVDDDVLLVRHVDRVVAAWRARPCERCARIRESAEAMAREPVVAPIRRGGPR